MKHTRRRGPQGGCYCRCPGCFKARHAAWSRVGPGFPSVTAAVQRALTENA